MREKIQLLVEKFKNNYSNYTTGSYNETQLRNEFLDPFFECLGWDIKNISGKPTNEREVILEESLKEDTYSTSKKPDYTFRLFSDRKFFLEAKKPYKKIESANDVAIQTRRYGWTAKLKISVQSNFEYLMIYDCSIKPEENDTYTRGLIATYHYSDYVEKFEELKNLLGRESVYSGLFDTKWENIEFNASKISIDSEFLNQINRWRVLLAQEIIKYKRDISDDLLNDYVQGYINSIIFLRVCEDRDIEVYKNLLEYSNKDNAKQILEKFKIADKRYNSGLFDIPLSADITTNLQSVFWNIVKELYLPERPYAFSVLSSSVLGNIYEIFLAQKVTNKEGIIELVNKPEHIDRDVITTPTYIVNSILSETLKDRIKGKGLEELLKIKVADISCGSGAFLLEAFQLICDSLIDTYLETDKSKLIQTSVNTYKLPIEIKKQILVHCIYGIDKDYNAIQSAKFGLLLKLLENENQTSLTSTLPILPKLDENIICGNTLVESKDIKNTRDSITINPFNPKFKFDVIIGNPPYMKTEDMKNLLQNELPIYKGKYKTAYKQFDKYYLFVERGIELLSEDGILGYILPSKFTKIGSGKELRKILSENKYLRKFVSFGANQIFQDRTTYTCLLILSNKPSEEFEFYEVDDLTKWQVRKLDEDNSNIIENLEINEDNWILLGSQMKEIYEKIYAKSLPLGQLIGSSNIFNGIQTSANDVFVISEWVEQDDLIIFKQNGIDYKVEKELTKPYFQTSNGIDNLYTYRSFLPNALLIYPYSNVENKIEFIHINDLQSNYPNTYNYLSANRSRLGERDIKPTPITTDEWYRYGRHQSLDKISLKPKIIVGVLSMGDKYAIDNEGTFITSGGTAGYCAITLPENTEYSIYFIQAILNSKYVEWIASLIGDVFRGGYYAHGTSVLNKLPVKTIDFDNTVEKNLHDDISALQEELIKTYSEIDRNADNLRVKDRYEQLFKELKEKLDNKLKELYLFNDEEEQKVININTKYEVN